MSTLGSKKALFAQFANVAKTLGHGHRLELLEQVAQGEILWIPFEKRRQPSFASSSFNCSSF
jgi:ArsR family transcriptional regulator